MAILGAENTNGVTGQGAVEIRPEGSNDRTILANISASSFAISTENAENMAVGGVVSRISTGTIKASASFSLTGFPLSVLPTIFAGSSREIDSNASASVVISEVIVANSAAASAISINSSAPNPLYGGWSLEMTSNT